MLPPRVIPSLLLKDRGLVKTVRFKEPTYVGDPINAVKIFNDKEVDELLLLDIGATNERRRPAFDLIEQIASEAFMPLGYGGGIRSLEDIATLLRLGIEKVVVNSFAVEDPAFVRAAAARFGSQSIVVSIDVVKPLFGGYKVCTHGGRRKTTHEPAAFAASMQQLGAGEILLTSIDRDGTMAGFDLELVRQVSQSVSVPVVACGGAASLADLSRAIAAGASAVSAGSMFVFHGRHRAVLISYPSASELRQAFAS